VILFHDNDIYHDIVFLFYAFLEIQLIGLYILNKLKYFTKEKYFTLFDNFLFYLELDKYSK